MHLHIFRGRRWAIVGPGVFGGLTVLLAMLLTGTSGAQEPVLISADAPLTSSELRNLSYPSDFTASGSAPLTDGAYSEPAAPGSAALVEVRFRRAAFGVLSIAPAAAVVLSTTTGGSGTFVHLHLVGRDVDGAPAVLASRLLGDRVRLQDLSIAQDLVRVDFTGFRPDDPLCCPTLNIVQRYALETDALRLVRAQESPALLDVPAGASLAGWYGAASSSTAILSSAGQIDVVWWFNPNTGGWIADSRELPVAFREPIEIRRGTGLFLIARAATQLPVPLVVAPAACPTNPGPTHPVDPSMIVHQPGQGEEFAGAVRVEGLARVFEATVRIRILGADGAILADTFTTATAGGPAFGAFDVEVPVALEAGTDACVQVFEESARDGADVNVVQLGVRLLPAS